MAGFRKKGSLTVEAVFVVPLCLLVCFLLVQTLLYLHHVSWYTAAAWECVLAGMQEGEDTETVNKRWESLKTQQVLPSGKIMVETETAGKTVCMRIRGGMSTLAGIPAMEFDLKIQRSLQEPASFLRKGKSVRSLSGIAGDRG